MVCHVDFLQAEYDHLESQYLLVCSELHAAQERIAHLLLHLERSEQVNCITLEKNQRLSKKVKEGRKGCCTVG